MSSLDLSPDLSCFPEGGATGQDCGFSLGHRAWPVFHTCSLSARACSHCYLQDLHTGSLPQSGERGRAGTGGLGMLTTQLGGSLGKVFLAAHTSASYWSPKCNQQKCIPLMPSDTLICIFPALTPQVTDAHVNTYCRRRGMGFFISIMHTWECIPDIHSHYSFSFQER